MICNDGKVVELKGSTEYCVSLHIFIYIIWYITESVEDTYDIFKCLHSMSHRAPMSEYIQDKSLNVVNRILVVPS